MAEQAEIDADLEGPVSPPRDNGEIVFAAPWERRLFGVTVALCREDDLPVVARRGHRPLEIGVDLGSVSHRPG